MFFSNQYISELLTMSECIQIMEKLFLLNIDTEVVNPLRSKMFLKNDVKGILGTMPAYIKPYNVMGVKVLSVFPDNYKKGLSSHQGILHLFETTTGKLISSLEADEITAIRTAAVSAVATNALAIEDAEALCIIGSGTQAKKHLEAMLSIRNIKNVNIWSKNRANAVKFAEEARTRYNIPLKVRNSVKEASRNADIICTVTSSNEPILENKYLKKHVHINAVGACTPDARELSSEIVLTSDVFVDSRKAAINEAGDVLIPAQKLGRDVHQFIKADISEILKDKTLYKPANKTVFKSVGLAVEDIAAGFYCYNKMNLD